MSEEGFYEVHQADGFECGEKVTENWRCGEQTKYDKPQRWVQCIHCERLERQ